MKKLVLIVALFLLLITYGNYRKHKVLSRLQNFESQPQPKPKPKRARALSYEEMAAIKRAEAADSLFSSTVNDSIISDSLTVSSIDSRDETIVITPDTTLLDTLNAEIHPDSL